MPQSTRAARIQDKRHRCPSEAGNRSEMGGGGRRDTGDSVEMEKANHARQESRGEEGRRGGGGRDGTEVTRMTQNDNGEGNRGK